MGADGGANELRAPSVAAAAAAIADGLLGAEDLARALIDRSQAAEPALQAWAFFDPEHALRQARQADAARKAGAPLGPLHGVPIAIDDLIDTDDQPTVLGSPIHAGRRPDGDATAVLLLRAAGALPFAKTATAELGAGIPAATVNPHDHRRSPGGACGGAAAAVAAELAPAAIAVQTSGGIIRSAAYCGVCGYKPTHGLISQQGTLDRSRILNHVGVLARTVEDLALVAEALTAFDPGDPDMRPRASPRLRQIATAEPPLPPRFCFVRSPAWDLADDETKEGLAELVAFLGVQAQEATLPSLFAEAEAIHRTISAADLAVALAPELGRGRDALSPALRTLIERGNAIPAADYLRAVQAIPKLSAALAPLFEAFDALLTPAAAGVAPVLAEGSGSAAFCSPWTLCGMPAVSLPLLQGAGGLPLGIQLVGPRGDDARLLRSARWLAATVLTPKPSRRSGRRR